MERSLSICRYASEIVAKGNHFRCAKNGKRRTILFLRSAQKMLNAERGPSADFAGQHGRKTQFNTIAVFVCTMQFAHVFVIFQQFPSAVIVA